MAISLEEANKKLIAMIDNEGTWVEVKKDIWTVITENHMEECDELSECHPDCFTTGHGYRTSDGVYHGHIGAAVRHKRQLKKEERESRGA